MAYNEQLSIPQAQIRVHMERRVGDLSQALNVYGEELSGYSGIKPLDQIMNLKVSVLPGDKRIFDMNPELFLFRYVNRQGISGNKQNRYIVNGKSLVHPSDSRDGVKSSRYRGGDHQNPYALLERVTEVPLNISTNTLTGEKEFYGGSLTSPDATLFEFRPLAWFSNSKDIAGSGITFPQPLATWYTGGLFDYGIGIESGYIQQGAGSPRYSFFYTGRGRRNNSTQQMNSYWGIGLMVDNPKYESVVSPDTQNPRKLLVSNIAEFKLSFKRGSLSDNAAGLMQKYAIDRDLHLL